MEPGIPVPTQYAPGLWLVPAVTRWYCSTFSRASGLKDGAGPKPPGPPAPRYTVHTPVKSGRSCWAATGTAAHPIHAAKKVQRTRLPVLLGIFRNGSFIGVSLKVCVSVQGRAVDAWVSADDDQPGELVRPRYADDDKIRARRASALRVLVVCADCSRDNRRQPCSKSTMRRAGAEQRLTFGSVQVPCQLFIQPSRSPSASSICRK